MINIDYSDRRPLYEQITDKLAGLMLAGVLKPGEKLPSVRSLATELSVNPNTISRAYGELERIGYIYSVVGKGSFVSGKENIVEGESAKLLKEMEELLKKAKSMGISRSKIEELLKNYPS